MIREALGRIQVDPLHIRGHRRLASSPHLIRGHPHPGDPASIPRRIRDLRSRLIPHRIRDHRPRLIPRRIPVRRHAVSSPRHIQGRPRRFRHATIREAPDLTQADPLRTRVHRPCVMHRRACRFRLRVRWPASSGMRILAWSMFN